MNNIQRLKFIAQGYEIFCDLDGTLVDFDKNFYEVTKMSPIDYINEYGLETFWEVIKEEGHFWLYLDWLPDGQELWDYIKNTNVSILTTPGGNIEECKKDKAKWVKKHIEKDIEREIPIIFSAKKYEYAHDKAILIDDMEINTTLWEDAGGISILHESAEITIKRLKQILQN